MKFLSTLGLVVMLWPIASSCRKQAAVSPPAGGQSSSFDEMTPGKAGLNVSPERRPSGNMRFSATYDYPSGSFDDYEVSLSVVRPSITAKGWDFRTKPLRQLRGENRGRSIVCVFDISPDELQATPDLAFTIVKSNNGDAPTASATLFVPLAKVLLLRSELSTPLFRHGCLSLTPLPRVKYSNETSLPPELLALARDAENEASRGNFAKAEAIYLQILEKAPNDLDSLSNLGIVLFCAGKGTLSEGPFKKAISLSPKGTYYKTMLG